MGDILLKRAYEAPSDDDGTRVLVDRLWPRGVAKDRLRAEWLRGIAPSPPLRKAWHAAPAERWGEFAARYRDELIRSDFGSAAGTPDEAESKERAEAIERLRSLAGAGRLTLVYAAKDTAHNHAAVLRDFLLHG